MKHQVKKIARRTIALFFYWTGLRVFFRGQRVGAPILMFHNVGHLPATDYLPDHMKISEKKLKRIIRRLTRSGYRTVTVTDLTESLSKGELQRDAVALTFDDGYRDNHEVLLPLLQETDATATVFVQTGPMRGNLNWLHHYFWVLDRVGPHRLGELVGERLDRAHLKEDVLHLASDAVAAEYELKRVLKYDVLPAERDALLASVFSEMGGDDATLAAEVYLSPDECRALDRSGVEVGAHTVNHLILSSLDIEEQRREIEGSLRDLESWLGHGVPAFAYPYGREWDYDDKTLKVLGELGFQSALTAMSGLNTPQTPPLELKRFAVNQESSLAELFCELDGVFCWLEEKGLHLRLG
ncbi:MAG: polysaccharide deacetylase family protein [Planctomycetota bacterium]|nr:polysaccharide deacetylase family protein [Planctomycetota bacterium]